MVSDHGGTSGGSHGGFSPEELTLPFIVSGGDAIKGTITPAPVNVNLVPIILTYLGIEIAPAWNLDGKVVGIRTALTISLEGGGVVARWQGSGVLQEATEPNGNWIDVVGSFSPHTNNLQSGTQFFRLKY